MVHRYFRKAVVQLLALLLMGVFFSNAHGQTATNDLYGDWVGGYEVDGQWHFVDAHFEPRGEEILGVFDFRHDKNMAVFANELLVGDDWRVEIALERDGSPLRFDGTLSTDQVSPGRIGADQINGTATADKTTGSFSFMRVHDLGMETYKGTIGNYQLGERQILLYSLQDFNWFFYLDTVSEREVRIYPLAEDRFISELGETITIVQPNDGNDISLIWQTLDGSEDGSDASAAKVEPYQVEEVRYPHGDITLAGTLLLPNAPGPHPAVVLMHSTMPQNRDYFRRWGHFFAEAGVAVLVYDKPGAFESAHPSISSFWENSAQNLADAALAGVHYLQSRPEINPEQVGIRTFSNSSWAGPIAAAQSDDVAFLIGTAVSGVAQRQADIFQIELNNIGYYDYPDWAAASALDYLRFTREFSIFARELALPLPAPYRDYYGVDFDPLMAWADVTQPVLVINGQYDTLVDPIDAVARIEQTLATSGHGDYTLVVYPDTDHSLLKTKTGLQAETRGGRDRIFAPGVMALETDWVRARFDGQGPKHISAQAVHSPVPVTISEHFEVGGRYELLPWYGRPTWQLLLFVGFVAVFLMAILALPLGVIVGRLRGREALSGKVRLAVMLAWLISLLGLMLIVGLVLTWVQIVHLHSGQYFGFPGFLVGLPVLGVIAATLIVGYLIVVVTAWRTTSWTRLGKAATVVFSVVGLLFIWYLGYWHLLLV